MLKKFISIWLLMVFILTMSACSPRYTKNTEKSSSYQDYNVNRAKQKITFLKEEIHLLQSYNRKLMTQIEQERSYNLDTSSLDNIIKNNLLKVQKYQLLIQKFEREIRYQQRQFSQNN